MKTGQEGGEKKSNAFENYVLKIKRQNGCKLL